MLVQCQPCSANTKTSFRICWLYSHRLEDNIWYPFCLHGLNLFTFFQLAFSVQVNRFQVQAGLIFVWFHFNMIWHRQYTLILDLMQFGMNDLCWRIAGNAITAPPLVTYVDWLHWWYYRTADVITSTALAFVTKMSAKCKSAPPSAVQVKSQWKKIGIEEKLDIISQLEKGDWTFDIDHNVKIHS